METLLLRMASLLVMLCRVRPLLTLRRSLFLVPNLYLEFYLNLKFVHKKKNQHLAAKKPLLRLPRMTPLRAVMRELGSHIRATFLLLRLRAPTFILMGPTL